LRTPSTHAPVAFTTRRAAIDSPFESVARHQRSDAPSAFVRSSDVTSACVRTRAPAAAASIAHAITTAASSIAASQKSIAPFGASASRAGSSAQASARLSRLCLGSVESRAKAS
jgi:hypothetical protein